MLYSLVLISCLLGECDAQVVDYNLSAADCWTYVHDFNVVAGVDEYSEGAMLLSCELDGAAIPLRDWWIGDTEISF
jgi:hypothetical protein